VNPPEYDAPHRTETQILGDDIATALRNLARDWPHMIRPGDTQAPGWRMREGGNRGSRDGVIDDFGRLRFPQDQSPEVGQKGESTDADQRRIDKTISLRRFATDQLRDWCRVVIEDRGTSNHIPEGTDAPDMAVFLERHAEWLSGHETAQDARDELTDLAHRCHLVAYPTRRESFSIGRCPQEIPGEQDVLEVCGGDVRSRKADEGEADGQAWCACNRCGEVAVASWWAERMFVDGEGSPLVTIGELVAVIAYRLQIVVTHDQIRQWKHRGKITSEGVDSRGRTLYRHEAVIDSIRAEARAKAAKSLGA
jgi:hypothetical protein